MIAGPYMSGTSSDPLKDVERARALGLPVYASIGELPRRAAPAA